ncbi:MAG: UDP-N-acetylmuramate--L-alanine ligase [Candidatus Omnitrophica bacterium]|nr:UDP-N-acetylmuramate--L-alanine ligase [Candidatus Omnitrophota bacterium]
MDKHYHLIGIGGIGMSGIAHLLLKRGARVSGSDLKQSKVIRALEGLGAKIFIGHEAGNISGADLVVYSSAVKEDNSEVMEAKKLGIPLIKRAEALAKLMQGKLVITVAGSHGKTTTTSLASYLLLEAGLSPTVAIGGILKNINTNACLGEGEYFVAEADESDGSFLSYHPKYSIITNIDREHLDYYRDFESELAAFKDFINNTDITGCVFYCADDPNLKALMQNCKTKSVSFGLKDSADIHPVNIKLSGLTSDFDCVYKGKHIDRFHLALGGEHNISNALSVIALGLELGIDLSFIKRTLAGYKGAARRLEIKFKDTDITVIDDYAHHPTEIRATLTAAAKLNPKRLIAVFQPHRYTRTKLLLDEFVSAFDAADYVIITDIYAASELPMEGVAGKSIFDKIKERSPAKPGCFLEKDKIVRYLINELSPGDLVITLGAGDIVKLSDELAEELTKKTHHI